MLGTGQATPRRAQVSDEHCGRGAGDPRHRLQPVTRGFTGGAKRFDLGIEARHRLIEAIELTSPRSQHNAMRGLDAAIPRVRPRLSWAAPRPRARSASA
jgi:hypothetical protein